MSDRLRLLSAFQVLSLGTPAAFGITRRTALDIVEDITGVALEPTIEVPVSRSLDDYMAWLERVTA